MDVPPLTDVTNLTGGREGDVNQARDLIRQTENTCVMDCGCILDLPLLFILVLSTFLDTQKGAPLVTKQSD